MTDKFIVRACNLCIDLTHFTIPVQNLFLEQNSQYCNTRYDQQKQRCCGESRTAANTPSFLDKYPPLSLE